MIRPADIKNICSEIFDFSQNANFCLEKNPVLTYEFSDIGEFSHARRTILSSMDQTLSQAYIVNCRNDKSNAKSNAAAAGKVIEEINYCGVTIRLICNQEIIAKSYPVTWIDPLTEIEYDSQD